MKNAPVLEVNATAVWDFTKSTPKPHPNQIRTLLLGMKGKTTKDGKVVRISEGAWNALATYQERFRGITSKLN